MNRLIRIDPKVGGQVGHIRDLSSESALEDMMGPVWHRGQPPDFGGKQAAKKKGGAKKKHFCRNSVNKRCDRKKKTRQTQYCRSHFCPVEKANE